MSFRSADLFMNDVTNSCELLYWNSGREKFSIICLLLDDNFLPFVSLHSINYCNLLLANFHINENQKRTEENLINFGSPLRLLSFSSWLLFLLVNMEIRQNYGLTCLSVTLQWAIKKMESRKINQVDVFLLREKQILWMFTKYLSTKIVAFLKFYIFFIQKVFNPRNQISYLNY